MNQPVFAINTPPFWLLPVLCALLLAASCGLGIAQAGRGGGQNPAPLELGKDALQLKIDAITAREDIDAKAKTASLKFYRAAQDNLASLAQYKDKAAEYKLAVKQAPEANKKVLKDLAALQKPGKQKPEDFSGLVTEELEQRLIIEKEKISNFESQLQKQENDLAWQNGRPPLIRQEMLAAQQDLEASQAKLAAPLADAEHKLEAEAERWYLKTQVEARAAELKMLDLENISNSVRVELLKNTVQLLDWQKSQVVTVVAAIDSVLAERRLQAAKQAQEALGDAEKALSGKHPAIQTLTRDNIQLSKELQDTTQKIDAFTEQKTFLEAQVTEIDADFKSADKKISLAGLSPALGKILREQRRNLQSGVPNGIPEDKVQDETAQASLALFKTEDRLKQLEDLDKALQRIMQSQVDAQLPGEQRMMVQAELRVLMNSQKDLLNKRAAAEETYLRLLGDVDFAQQQWRKQAAKFADFLDQRLLWVPSSEPVNVDFLPAIYQTLGWLLAPGRWAELAADLPKAVYFHPFRAFVWLSLWLSVLLMRPWAKARLQRLMHQAGNVFGDPFLSILQAIALLLLLALPLPLAGICMGWLLNNTAEVGGFSKALGVGLQAAALPLLFINFFYRLTAPLGLAHQHFHWSAETVALLRKELTWLPLVAVPCVLLIQLTQAAGNANYSDSLGRMALVLSMVAMTVFLARILPPRHGVFAAYLAGHPRSWAYRCRYLWFGAALLLPMVINGFALAGYYLSALELQQKLIITLRLVFLVALAHALVYRWLALVNRQLAMENEQQRRRLASEPARPHVVGVEEVVVATEELIDLPKINAQTNQLLNVTLSLALLAGVLLIWQNIFPAFAFLDDIRLWEYQTTVDSQDVLRPVTLTNLLLAGFYLFLTVVSVVNFSGLMEILLFHHTRLETGSRYAINKLAKYLLVTVGMLSAANELGGSWAQVQWLVAALGVGLGFGLQEIFANLVSGIILLFERPIRVGDTVTIGDVTGKVSRIQMRATTIMDWDQKELIVPNKTFITNQLVNWTLSDAITRIVIPVSIAYGTDLETAHALMIKTVENTPLVLAEPKPSVLLGGFGDSALHFTIYAFVSEMSHRLLVVHELHLRLEKALREAGIEIPLPQREVHVRSMMEEGKVRVS